MSLNLINHQQNIDKTYHVKDPSKAEHKFVIDKCKHVGLKNYNDPKVLLNTRMNCRIYIKILKFDTLEKSVKF